MKEEEEEGGGSREEQEKARQEAKSQGEEGVCCVCAVCAMHVCAVLCVLCVRCVLRVWCVLCVLLAATYLRRFAAAFKLPPPLLLFPAAPPSQPLSSLPDSLSSIAAASDCPATMAWGNLANARTRPWQRQLTELRRHTL